MIVQRVTVQIDGTESDSTESTVQRVTGFPFHTASPSLRHVYITTVCMHTCTVELLHVLLGFEY